MLINRSQMPILLFIALSVIGFGAYYIISKNYEFMVYIAVILFFAAIVVLTNRRVQYSNPVLWGLSAWAVLHLAGGSLKLNGEVIYKLMLIPVTADIFRYDQLVHIIGFGVSTLLMYELLRPNLKDSLRWVALSIVIVMAGLGVGAVNEIIEYITTKLVADTGIGGYDNNMLDLTADLIGAILAIVIIRLHPDYCKK